MMPRREPEDDLLDALALVEAFRRDDENSAADVTAVLRGCNSYGMALTLAKLLAAAADERDASPAHLRDWAAQAVNR